MKKTFLLSSGLMLAGLLAFSSCSRDDEDCFVPKDDSALTTRGAKTEYLEDYVFPVPSGPTHFISENRPSICYIVAQSGFVPQDAGMRESNGVLQVQNFNSDNCYSLHNLTQFNGSIQMNNIPGIGTINLPLSQLTNVSTASALNGVNGVSWGLYKWIDLSNVEIFLLSPECDGPYAGKRSFARIYLKIPGILWQYYKK